MFFFFLWCCLGYGCCICFVMFYGDIVDAVG